jgi:hypothetical protein
MRYHSGERVALVSTDVMRPVNVFHAVVSQGPVESPRRQCLAAVAVIGPTRADSWPYVAEPSHILKVSPGWCPTLWRPWEPSSTVEDRFATESCAMHCGRQRYCRLTA